MSYHTGGYLSMRCKLRDELQSIIVASYDGNPSLTFEKTVEQVEEKRRALSWSMVRGVIWVSLQIEFSSTSMYCTPLSLSINEDFPKSATVGFPGSCMWIPSRTPWSDVPPPRTKRGQGKTQKAKRKLKYGCIIKFNMILI